jgi:RimJ/RimL family protein N-acetyltransferase
LENNQTIGTTSLNDIDLEKGTAELSIIIGIKEFWGRGLATEAIMAVIKYAREDLKLRQLTAGFEAGNLAMAKVLQKFGFAEVTPRQGSRIIVSLNL